MPKSAGYVDPETLQRVAEQLQPLKQRLYDLLQLGPGAHVLSVGCGPGIDTLPLAQRVGPGGKVVGIDIDEEMISLATAKAQAAGVDAGVSHHVADLLDLPFDPYTFHACLADRVLQVLPTSVDPQHALSAMYQVTRPGGWVVVADADWSSASVDSDDIDLERRLVRFFADHLRPNGYAGRQLYRLFRRQGFVDLAVELFPAPFFSPRQTPYYKWVPREARAAGTITAAEERHWQTWIEQAEAAGTFFSSVHMVIVAGRVPT